MRTLLTFLACCLLLAGCGEVPSLTVTVTNPLPSARAGEMIELPLEDIARALGKEECLPVAVYSGDSARSVVPSQVTYDGKLIFPVSVPASGEATYRLLMQEPDSTPVRCTGRVYPQRLDDLAWENELVAFRTYGPALQATGERGFGYDLFAKHTNDRPVLETMYRKVWANIRKNGLEKKVKAMIRMTNGIHPAKARMAAKKKVFRAVHNSFGGKLRLLISGGAAVDPGKMKHEPAVPAIIVQNARVVVLFVTVNKVYARTLVGAVRTFLYVFESAAQVFAHKTSRSRNQHLHDFAPRPLSASLPFANANTTVLSIFLLSFILLLLPRSEHGCFDAVLVKFALRALPDKVDLASL